MAGYEGESERMWDEYDWERFLQQQDQKTEKYMELLEKYLDDPQRDQIIAREMGWTQLLDARTGARGRRDARRGSGRRRTTISATDQAVRSADDFEDHSLYRAAFALDGLDRSAVRSKTLRSKTSPRR